MTKELLEIKTGQWKEWSMLAPSGPNETKYFIAEPIRQGGEPRVRLYSEDEIFIEEFMSWTHMRAQFEQRGWEVMDSTIWDDSDTYVGYYRERNELAKANI